MSDEEERCLAEEHVPPVAVLFGMAGHRTLRNREEVAMAIGFLLALAVWIFFGTLSLLGTAFWVWMIADCAINEPSQGNDKLVWLLVIILLPFIGSLLYYFIRRPERPVVAQYSTK